MMWRAAAGLLAIALVLTGCTRYEPSGEMTRAFRTETEAGSGTDGENPADRAPESGEAAEESSGSEEGEEIVLSSYPQRTPVKVKGIYVSAFVAGTEEMMDRIIEQIDETELNSVVIDFKDDQGRITCQVDTPFINEISACRILINDMPALMRKLKEHDIYPIARIVTFRDPYLAEQKPEWSLHVADGSIYRDKQGLAWVNPYKKEVWEYLVEVGKKAGELGFREIQFDYIRFAVDRTMKNAVFDEADTLGRDKTQVIGEFIEYAYEELAREGLFVSADVFGTIIRSSQDAASVGQDYGKMAEQLDYICPMIYPSHYGPGSFGIDSPDTQPYETILNALQGSGELLAESASEDGRQAVVRPWLQDFTASYLKEYIDYGDEQVRQQIQAVYDAGYEEWILWDAGVSYHYGGLEPGESRQ
ncbi:MAG: putative glycoside hydrolase [Enterocloster sp.]